METQIQELESAKTAAGDVVTTIAVLSVLVLFTLFLFAIGRKQSGQIKQSLEVNDKLLDATERALKVGCESIEQSRRTNELLAETNRLLTELNSTIKNRT